MQIISFKPNFHVEIIDSERVVLFTEDQHHLLQGYIYVAIAKLIIGNPLSEEALIGNLLSKFPKELIGKTLDRLKIKGFITNNSENLAKNIKAFWSDLRLENFENTQSVVIKNFSSQDPSELINILKSLSLRVSNSGDFFIVIVDNYISEELEEFNNARLSDGKPWMLMKPSGRIIWIGPIFEPNRTGCWNCLAERLKENRRVEVDLFGLKNKNLNIPSLPYLATTHSIAMNLAANEVAKWKRSKQAHQLNCNLLTLDLANMEMRLHPFKNLANCLYCQKACGSCPKCFPTLKSSPKKYFLEEGERTCSLDDTLNNLQDIISPFTGIISSIRHSIVNDEHICYTVRTLPLPALHNAENRYFRVPDVATGKGKTKLQATVGCIAEAIERYNCTFSTQEEIRCSYDSIKNTAIHPYALLNFSEEQYNNREIINANRSGFNRIPKRYEGTEIGWTAVHSITHNRVRLIPSSYCYLYYPFEKDVEICPGNSNGCASGNSLEEAIFYALLELVERDAVAIWWYNRIKRPSVDLDRLNNAKINQIREKLKKEHRNLYVLDLTTDLQIPCYIAVSHKSDGTQIFFGSGAHLQPEIGIMRAISELNQVMIRANLPQNIDLASIAPVARDLVKWSISETIDNHSHLIPNGISKPISLYPNSEDFLSDIDLCLKIFKSLDLEALFFNLTNPNIKLHTVRLIIPGLRHFWSRLGPGRLYDAPVSLGWISKPLSESAMNPTPYFL